MAEHTTTPHRPRRIAVFCASNVGTSEAYVEAARAVGTACAQRQIGIVYGGGRVGLMGAVADAALAEGGDVVGVITEQLVRAEVAHDELTCLEVVESMHQRKARMADLADGFVVLPGGFGTLDELAEIVTWNQLGLLARPVVLFDVDGYWESLFTWMEDAVTAGFVRPAHRMILQRATTVDAVLALAVGPVPDVGTKWIDLDAPAGDASLPTLGALG